MGKTLSLVIKNLQSFVEDCYDTIALFLCLHLMMRYQLICHKRAVPALDKYWETLTNTIWPRYLNMFKSNCNNNYLIILYYYNLQNYICFFRFEFVFQLNINSVKDCDPSKFNKETGPHYVSVQIQWIVYNGIFNYYIILKRVCSSFT